MSAYSGLRLVDFSQGLAGPMAAMLLADLGAEVVKVEPPCGDRVGDRPGYLACNRNKQVLTLDLDTADGMAAARELIAGADVALFDYAPSRMAALAFEAEPLMARHPGLIHAWMPPYGTRGHYSEMPPSHSLLSALTGNAYHQGAFSDVPIHLVLPVLWHSQAVMGAAAIGAAVRELTRSGQGQSVVVGGLHGAAATSMYARMANGSHFPRYRPGQNPGYRLYRCGDGQWLFLGALFDVFVHRALAVLGLGDVAQLARSDPFGAADRIQKVIATRSREEWLAELRAKDVPCAPVQSREQWFASPTIAEAGMRVSLEHPRLGPVDMPAPPARLSETPAVVRHLPQAITDPPAWSPRVPTGTGGVARLPLEGVRVLDLGAVVAGAYTGTILASLGADVIKIEPPEGDRWRSDAAGFLGINRGKRGLGLDLKHAEARAVFFELARAADVVIDNFRVGVKTRLGIDHSSLAAVNPAIISCSITGYGDVGERASRPVFDPLLQAESGMMAAQGGDEDPIVQTIAVNDIAAAAVAVMAVVAALNARELTGKGQEIVTSLMAQSLLYQLGEMVTYDGRPDSDKGAVDCTGIRALHRYYACADAWLGIECNTAAEAEALERALGMSLGPAPLEAPREGAVAGQLAGVFAGMNRSEALALLAAAKVPSAPVIQPADVWDDAWLAENDFSTCWHHPRLGEVLTPTGYARFSGGGNGLWRPAPDIGEHSAEILAEAGLSPDAIARLMGQGAGFTCDGQGKVVRYEAGVGESAA